MTKTNRISFLSLALLASMLFADEGMDMDAAEKSSTVSDEIRTNAGYTQIKSGEGIYRTDEVGEIEDNNLDTVIYNDIKNRMSHQYTTTINQETSRGKAKGIVISLPQTKALQESIAIEEKHKEDEKIRLSLTKDKENKTISYFVGGYCTVNTPVKIIRTSEFTTLNCSLNFGNGEYRDAEVFAGVYPNYKKETLTMLPIYASFSNQKKLSLDGIVFTQNKSSLNIADHVENFKIRELVAEYGLAINDVAYRYSLDFMRVYQESQRRTKVEYVTVDDPNVVSGSRTVPIVTEQTKPPRMEDYFYLAGIELVSKLFSIGAKNMLEDTEPLFRIFKDKRVYVEGIATMDNKGLSRKYGRIAVEARSDIKKDNEKWKQKKDKTIRKYDQSKLNSRNFQIDAFQSGRQQTGYPSSPYINTNPYGTTQSTTSQMSTGK